MRFIFGDSKVTEIVVKPQFKIDKKEAKEFRNAIKNNKIDEWFNKDKPKKIG